MRANRAVSLRAAQLLAGDSFMRRRSVAPLGASLAFGEIATGARAPADGLRSNNRVDTRPHARPRKGSCVPTHLCHHASPREHVPHHHDPRVTPLSTQAGSLVRSRPRDLRVNPWRAARASALPKQNGALAGRPRP